jgi:hypothetical protein
MPHGGGCLFVSCEKKQKNLNRVNSWIRPSEKIYTIAGLALCSSTGFSAGCRLVSSLLAAN